jgi:multidrug efflux pump subunit AcrA (membrane-fusion protein)
LNGSDSRIRAGMTANATIMGQTVENVLAVPSSAIISQNSGNFVLAKSGTSSFSQQKVGIGISGGGYTEITSGLSAGTLVATFGNKSRK